MPIVGVKAQLRIDVSTLSDPKRRHMANRARKLENVADFGYDQDGALITVILSEPDRVADDLLNLADMDTDDWWEWLRLAPMEKRKSMVDKHGFSESVGRMDILTACLDGKRVEVANAMGPEALLSDESPLECTLSMYGQSMSTAVFESFEELSPWLTAMGFGAGRNVPEENLPMFGLKGYKTADDFAKRRFVPLDDDFEDSVTACAMAGFHLGTGMFELVKVDDGDTFIEVFSTRDLNPGHGIDTIVLDEPGPVDRLGKGPYRVAGHACMDNGVPGRGDVIRDGIVERDDALVTAGVSIAAGKWDAVSITPDGGVPMFLARDGVKAPAGVPTYPLPVDFIDEAAGIIEKALEDIDLLIAIDDVDEASEEVMKDNIRKGLSLALRIAGKIE